MNYFYENIATSVGIFSVIILVIASITVNNILCGTTRKMKTTLTIWELSDEIFNNHRAISWLLWGGLLLTWTLILQKIFEVICWCHGR